MSEPTPAALVASAATLIRLGRCPQCKGEPRWDGKFCDPWSESGCGCPCHHEADGQRD